MYQTSDTHLEGGRVEREEEVVKRGKDRGVGGGKGQGAEEE